MIKAQWTENDTRNVLRYLLDRKNSWTHSKNADISAKNLPDTKTDMKKETLRNITQPSSAFKSRD